MPPKRVCLVSPGHVASNPRLVKEANSLYAAGFQVRVVAGDYMEEIRPLDRTILETVPWKWTTVGLGTKVGYVGRKLLQETSRKISRNGWNPKLLIATWAHSPMSNRLMTAAAAEPADLYIAHNLAALPAAAKAAHRHCSRFGFDAEDFHTGELLDTPENQAEIEIRDRIERTLLPQCHHLTAASPLIADAYQKRYGISMQSILNVFPLSDAPSSFDWRKDIGLEEQTQQRIGTEPSLYWFSQTIGSGRGLEMIIRAMSKMKTRARLYLRGILAAGYERTLRQLAAEVGMGDRLHFLPPAPPAEMVRLAAYHDIGLSLELTEPFNRAICLTNKIFVYLLAGLPVVMSKTTAQEKLSYQLGEAAMMIGEEPETIAAALDCWLANSAKLEHRRKIAWELGQTVYNWDVEQKQFLNIVENVFNLIAYT